MSRYLFISDMHINEENRDAHLMNLRRIIKDHDIDYIISCGDNGDIDSAFVKSLGIPFYSIYGNNDRMILDIIWLSDDVHKIGKLNILSFYGILAIHPKKRYHRALTRPVDLVNVLPKDTHVDIVITHDIPERATVDVGHKVPAWHGVIDYIDQQLNPKYHIYGHYHSSYRVVVEDKIFNTTGIRVDSSWATHGIVIDDEDIENYKIVYGTTVKDE